jgi:hypothetical protein
MSFRKVEKNIRMQVNLSVAEVIGYIYNKKWVNTSDYVLKNTQKNG